MGPAGAVASSAGEGVFEEDVGEAGLVRCPRNARAAVRQAAQKIGPSGLGHLRDTASVEIAGAQRGCGIYQCTDNEKRWSWFGMLSKCRSVIASPCSHRSTPCLQCATAPTTGV